MRLRRALFPALAAVSCVALIAAGCGDNTPTEPVAVQADEQTAPATAESDARASSSDVALSSSDRDFAFAEGGACVVPWVPANSAPEGVTIEGWGNADFAKAEDEPVVIAALSAETGVDAAEFECVFAEGGGEPDPAAPAAGAIEEAAQDDIVRDPVSPEPGSADSDQSVGYGFCGTDWEPEIAPGTLPDGATLGLNLNATFGPKSLLEPARAAIAEASGRPLDSITCNHEIPPIGECSLQLGPGGDDLPEGARVEGNIFGTYIRPGDKARVQAAVAKLASVDVADVRCMDFDDERFDDEPIPVEPNDAPATSEAPDPAVSGPAPE